MRQLAAALELVRPKFVLPCSSEFIRSSVQVKAESLRSRVLKLCRLREAGWSVSTCASPAVSRGATPIAALAPHDVVRALPMHDLDTERAAAPRSLMPRRYDDQHERPQARTTQPQTNPSPDQSAASAPAQPSSPSSRASTPTPRSPGKKSSLQLLHEKLEAEKASKDSAQPPGEAKPAEEHQARSGQDSSTDNATGNVCDCHGELLSIVRLRFREFGSSGNAPF